MDGGGEHWTAQCQPQTSQLSETPRASSELNVILGLLLPLWVSAHSVSPDCGITCLPVLRSLSFIMPQLFGNSWSVVPMSAAGRSLSTAFHPPSHDPSDSPWTPNLTLQ